MDNLGEMDKFLETYNLPRLNQDESENLNRLITVSKIESVIENLKTSKSAGPDGFAGEFYQTFKEELIHVLQSFPQNLRRRKTPKLILQGHHYLDSETRQRHFKKKCKSISLVNTGTKMLNEIFATKFSNTLKRSLIMIK